MSLYTALDIEACLPVSDHTFSNALVGIHSISCTYHKYRSSSVGIKDSFPPLLSFQFPFPISLSKLLHIATHISVTHR